MMGPQRVSKPPPPPLPYTHHPLACAVSGSSRAGGGAEDKDTGLKQSLIATILSNLQLSIRKVWT